MFLLFFFDDPAPPEIYTLSLHDALPIYCSANFFWMSRAAWNSTRASSGFPSLASKIPRWWWLPASSCRSEEHTSELQSRENLVCRLLLEKKKKKKKRRRRHAVRERSRTR